MADSFEFSGYFVIDTWGNIRRTTINLMRRDDGQWYRDGKPVEFREDDSLPAEEDRGGWNSDMGSVKFHRPDREYHRGIVVAGESDAHAVFVLDSDAVEVLEREGATIRPLPTDNESQDVNARIVGMLQTEHPRIYAKLIKQLGGP